MLNVIVYLVIFDGSDVVYIDKIEQVNLIRFYFLIGKRVFVYCIVFGKVMFSKFLDEEVEKMLFIIFLQLYI